MKRNSDVAVYRYISEVLTGNYESSNVDNNIHRTIHAGALIILTYKCHHYGTGTPGVPPPPHLAVPK